MKKPIEIFYFGRIYLACVEGVVFKGENYRILCAFSACPLSYVGEVVSSFSLLLAVTKAHTHLITRFSIYILQLLNFVRNKISLETSLHLFARKE